MGLDPATQRSGIADLSTNLRQPGNQHFTIDLDHCALSTAFFARSEMVLFGKVPHGQPRRAGGYSLSGKSAVKQKQPPASCSAANRELQRTEVVMLRRGLRDSPVRARIAESMGLGAGLPLVRRVRLGVPGSDRTIRFFLETVVWRSRLNYTADFQGGQYRVGSITERRVLGETGSPALNLVGERGRFQGENHGSSGMALWRTPNAPTSPYYGLDAASIPRGEYLARREIQIRVYVPRNRPSTWTIIPSGNMDLHHWRSLDPVAR